jgi:hypothetical protein
MFRKADTRLSSFLPPLWSTVRIIAHERRGAIILIALQRRGAIIHSRGERNLNLKNLIVE